MTAGDTVHGVDITLQSAIDQAAAVASKQISARELLAATLARYEAFNPTINAVVYTQIAEAQQRADQADQATARGDSWGPLHGLPMTIKEAWDWVGSPSTSGYADRQAWRPTRNSEAIDRLLKAGAIVYGKTNLPVSMADWQTFNDIYGTTANPWNPDLIPGGSSGGAAAALAAGMTSLELGSDIGASIRNPSHYCGVFGHKPTYGLVPLPGHGNPEGLVELDIGVGGPMARHSADLRLGLDIVAGAGGLDAVGWRLDLPESPHKALADYKVAVMLESPCVEQDQELTDQLAATVEALNTLGVQVDWHARPDLDIERSHQVYLMLLRSATGTELTPEAFAAQAPHGERYRKGDRDYRALAGHAITMSHWEWAQLNMERAEMRQRWAQFFEHYDLLLCPTAASAAYPHDHSGERPDRTIPVNGGQASTMDQLFWAGWSCGVYLPGTVAPAGLTRSGLPCGLQIVAPHLHDYRGITFAGLMERELGGYQVPPGYETVPNVKG